MHKMDERRKRGKEKGEGKEVRDRVRIEEKERKGRGWRKGEQVGEKEGKREGRRNKRERGGGTQGWIEREAIKFLHSSQAFPYLTSSDSSDLSLDLQDSLS